MTAAKSWMSWSTGKDSAYSLYEAQQSGRWRFTKLLTTVTQDYDRVAMHATRRQLLQKQSEALGIGLQVIEIPKGCSNEIYQAAFLEAADQALEDGIRTLHFGDLFLEEIRSYREQLLAPIGITCEFPLWQRETRTLAHAMIDAGFEAYLTCIDSTRLPRDFVGRRFDESLLADLPAGVDPCGDNGEFHTFVAYAPNFKGRIPVKPGELREDGPFVFRDFLL